MNKELKYHVRKTWADTKSQVGIDYSFLINAKKACDKLNGYSVFDSNGIQVYPEIIKEEKPMFNRGDIVQITKGALFVNGNAVPEIYNGEKLVVKSVEENGYVLSYGIKMPPIGVAINKDHVMVYNEIFAAEIDPYYVHMTQDTNIYLAPSTEAKIIKVAPYMSLYKIVNEKDGWGKLEIGAGWINLAEVMVIKNEK